MREDDRDSAGVVVGGVLATLARASASETADRYETAVGMGGKPGVGFFLNMEGVGDLLNAMGDGEEAREGITVRTATVGMRSSSSTAKRGLGTTVA